MTEEFAFNARQYFDFSKGTDDLNDSYFDTNFEENELPPVVPCSQLYEDITEGERQAESDTENDCFFSPIESGISGSTIYIKSKVRKSLSMSNLAIDNNTNQAKLSEDLNDLKISNEPQLRGTSLTSLNKACSQEHINRLARPKYSNSTNSLTLAEAVVKFQAGTPKRFRSKPPIKSVQIPRVGTIAHSPKLRTTTRTRPVTAISQEEQEKRQVEEMKKYKIKAQPLSKRVLKGPLKPVIGKKPITEHLTIEIKQNEHEMKVHQPSIRKMAKINPSKEENKELVNKCSQHVLKPTLPKPFSFDKRDQQLMKKKEEFINKVLEEEKKAREFHARPLPKSILRSRNSSLDEISESGSVKSSKQNTQDSIAIFKARPATVLHQKPFIPKKSDHHLIVESFQFSTDQRLEARHKFDEKLKEKEAQAEANKRKHEELLRKQHEEEIARLRRQMEHKAQPIKKFKELKVVQSKKVTEPISPKFHTDRVRDKENIN